MHEIFTVAENVLLFAVCTLPQCQQSVESVRGPYALCEPSRIEMRASSIRDNVH